MEAIITLFKNGNFQPVSSAFVTIPEGKTPDEAVLIATHELMKQFRVELVTEETNEFEIR